MAIDYKYNNRLTGFTNNSKSVLVFVYDSSDNLMDITDYDASLYMQKYPIRSGQPIDVAVSHFSKDPSNGAFLFQLSPTDLSLNAGDYIYEVIIDNSINRYTVVQDDFNLIKSIV